MLGVSGGAAGTAAAVHGLFVGLGVLGAVVVFVLEARRRGHTDDRLLVVVTGVLVGGALLVRLGAWLTRTSPCGTGLGGTRPRVGGWAGCE
ncbi:hypothetical protein GCM10027596_39160 [Nocardioides korecus]